MNFSSFQQSILVSKPINKLLYRLRDQENPNCFQQNIKEQTKDQKNFKYIQEFSEYETPKLYYIKKLSLLQHKSQIASDDYYIEFRELIKGKNHLFQEIFQLQFFIIENYSVFRRKRQNDWNSPLSVYCNQQQDHNTNYPSHNRTTGLLIEDSNYQQTFDPSNNNGYYIFTFSFTILNGNKQISLDYFIISFSLFILSSKLMYLYQVQYFPYYLFIPQLQNRIINKDLYCTLELDHPIQLVKSYQYLLQSQYFSQYKGEYLIDIKEEIKEAINIISSFNWRVLENKQLVIQDKYLFYYYTQYQELRYIMDSYKISVRFN